MSDHLFGPFFPTRARSVLSSIVVQLLFIEGTYTDASFTSIFILASTTVNDRTHAGEGQAGHGHKLGAVVLRFENSTAGAHTTWGRMAEEVRARRALACPPCASMPTVR